jgi:hypothetical protein
MGKAEAENQTVSVSRNADIKSMQAVQKLIFSADDLNVAKEIMSMDAQATGSLESLQKVWNKTNCSWGSFGEEKAYQLFCDNLYWIPTAETDVLTLAKLYQLGQADHKERNFATTLLTDRQWAQTFIDDLAIQQRYKVIEKRLEDQIGLEETSTSFQEAQNEAKQYVQKYKTYLQKFLEKKTKVLDAKAGEWFYSDIYFRYHDLLGSVATDEQGKSSKTMTDYQKTVAMETILFDENKNFRGFEVLNDSVQLEKISDQIEERIWKERKFFNQITVDRLLSTDAHFNYQQKINHVWQPYGPEYVQARIRAGLPIENEIKLFSFFAKRNKFKLKGKK